MDFDDADDASGQVLRVTSRTERFEIVDVERFPESMAAGKLYVSHKFGSAAHLCACGCGSRVITPFGPLDWSLSGPANSPTLYPSIGNWNLPCQSHYWVREGRVCWARAWSRDEIIESRRREALAREKAWTNARRSWWDRLVLGARALFGRVRS